MVRKGRRPGRPTSRTLELEVAILEHVGCGRSLREIGALEGMPHAATLYRWVADHQTFRDAYESALETWRTTARSRARWAPGPMPNASKARDVPITLTVKDGGPIDRVPAVYGFVEAMAPCVPVPNIIIED
jgi:hypothetical protein